MVLRSRGPVCQTPDEPPAHSLLPAGLSAKISTIGVVTFHVSVTILSSPELSRPTMSGFGSLRKKTAGVLTGKPILRSVHVSPLLVPDERASSSSVVFGSA